MLSTFCGRLCGHSLSIDSRSLRGMYSKAPRFGFPMVLALYDPFDVLALPFALCTISQRHLLCKSVVDEQLGIGYRVQFRLIHLKMNRENRERNGHVKSNGSVLSTGSYRREFSKVGERDGRRPGSHVTRSILIKKARKGKKREGKERRA